MPAKALSLSMPDVTRCPASLKPIVPFIQRAREVQGKSPVVAYWCLYNAARLGLPLSKGKDNDAKNYIEYILKYLEASKAALHDDAAISDTDMACSRIETFASNIFDTADGEDRLGVADKDTAKKFLAASYFMQLLAIFDREEEVRDKIRYAKWKAADISKALREGRVPQSGPAGGEPDLMLDEGFGAGVVGDMPSFPVAPQTSSLSPPAGSAPNSVSPSAWSTVATPGPDYAEERRREGLWPQESPTPPGKSTREAGSLAEEGDDGRFGNDDASEEDRGYWSTASTPGVGIVDGSSMFSNQQGPKPAQAPSTTSTNSYPTSNVPTNYSEPPTGLAKQAPVIRRVRFTESTAGGSEDLNQPPPPSPVVELRPEQAAFPPPTNGVQPAASSAQNVGTTRAPAHPMEGLPSVISSANVSPDPSSTKSGGSPPRDSSGTGPVRNGSAYPSLHSSSQGSSGKPESSTLPPTIPTSQRERRPSLVGGRSGPATTGLQPDDRRDGPSNLPPIVTVSAPGRDRSGSLTGPANASTGRDKRDVGPPTIVPPGRERRNSVTRRDDSGPSQDSVPPTGPPPSTSQRRNSITGRDGPPPTVPPVSRGRAGSVSGQAPDGTRYLGPTPSSAVPPAAPVKQSSPSQPAHMPLPSPSGSTNPSAHTSPDNNLTPLPNSSTRLAPQAPGATWTQGQGTSRSTLPASYPPPASGSGHAPSAPPPSSASQGPAGPGAVPFRTSPIPGPSASAPPAPVVTSPPQPSAPVDPTVIAQVQRHAKFAISALNYEDFPTAKKELLAALALIPG